MGYPFSWEDCIYISSILFCPYSLHASLGSVPLGCLWNVYLLSHEESGLVMFLDYRDYCGNSSFFYCGTESLHTGPADNLNGIPIHNLSSLLILQTMPNLHFHCLLTAACSTATFDKWVILSPSFPKSGSLINNLVTW